MLLLRHWVIILYIQYTLLNYHSLGINCICFIQNVVSPFTIVTNTFNHSVPIGKRGKKSTWHSTTTERSRTTSKRCTGSIQSRASVPKTTSSWCPISRCWWVLYLCYTACTAILKTRIRIFNILNYSYKYHINIVCYITVVTVMYYSQLRRRANMPPVSWDWPWPASWTFWRWNRSSRWASVSCCGVMRTHCWNWPKTWCPRNRSCHTKSSVCCTGSVSTTLVVVIYIKIW